MRNGQAKDCPPKPNGSLQPEAEVPANYMPGATSLNRKENGWRIPGRGNSLRLTEVKMASAVLLRLNNFHQTTLDCTISAAMYGNGATTGTVPTITKHLPTQNCPTTPGDQMNLLILWSQPLKRKCSVVV